MMGSYDIVLLHVPSFFFHNVPWNIPHDCSWADLPMISMIPLNPLVI